MKKLYVLTLLFLTVSFSFGQEAVITGYIDSTCPGQDGRTIEIYVDGTIDFTGWNLVRQANGGGYTTNIDLSSFGTIADSFIYVTNNSGTVETEFNILLNVLENNTISDNGNDGYQIVDDTGIVIDRFGEENVDGTGTAWEHEDTYYYRNDGTPANGGAFDPVNWTFGAQDLLDTEGRCNNEGDIAFAFSNTVPFGTYQHNALSEEQTDIEGFNLYPNPVTNNKVTITTARNLTKDIAIFDVLGKQVLNRRLPGNVLDVAALDTGIYIIKITEDRKTITRKLVIR
ncbi:MAG: T9SS type A sorting domain-containing protein [Bacteroidota bacterium]